MKKNSSKIFSSGEHKLVSLAKFAAFVFTKPGLALIRKVVRKKLAGAQSAADRPVNYGSWLAKEAGKYKQNGSGVRFLVYFDEWGTAIDEELLIRAIQSVQNQQYANWEMYIPCGVPSAVSSDSRIRSNGKADVDNAVYALYMRHDDVIAPWCLPVLAAYIAHHPEAAIIYADNDRIDEAGKISAPFFKPGWSPDTLLSRNYIGHNIIVRAVAGNSMQHPLEELLHTAGQNRPIAHIPLVLFHCGSTTPPASQAPQLLTEALKKQGIDTTVAAVPGTNGCFQVNYRVNEHEKVSIIIPTKDNTELLQKTIDSILNKTDYPNYEIIVLNNNSTSPAFFALMELYAAQHTQKFRCVAASFPFNFPKLMNMGAQVSTGTYLLLCNNDVEVLHSDWMTQMVGQAKQQHTGAVGAKLLFPDDTIQHAGIALGGDEASEHIFAHESKDHDGYFYSLKATTNYAAVTAACLMCRKAVYEQVGGMDEALAVEYNDVDLCLKFLKAGYYNVVLPSVVLYHFESATRGHPFRSKASWQQHEIELKLFTHRWQAIIKNDPYYRTETLLNFQFTDASGI